MNHSHFVLWCRVHQWWLLGICIGIVAAQLVYALWVIDMDWEGTKFWWNVDVAFWFWRKLGLCPECHRRLLNHGCANERCQRFDMELTRGQ